MGNKKFLPFLLVTVLMFAFGFSDSVLSETIKDRIKKDSPKPMVIKSQTMEIDDETKIVTFVGDVNAEQDDFTIKCKTMRVYYDDSSKQKKDKSKTRIIRIIATGNVIINRIQGGVATSKKAVYYEQDQKIVLTGNPVVKQGHDFVEGDRITIFLNENKSVVEGLNDRRVKAVIFPNRVKR